MELSKSETEYYPEICNYLKDQLLRSLSTVDGFIVDFIPCGTIDLRSGLLKMLTANEIEDEQLKSRAELAKGLYVDIAGIVYSKDAGKGELVICEVKKGDLTLAHCSQLIGYCIAADIPYGLLISVDGGITGGFESVLNQKPSLFKIDRLGMTHRIGICSWVDSRKLVFNRGAFRSMLEFGRELGVGLTKN